MSSAGTFCQVQWTHCYISRLQGVAEGQHWKSDLVVCFLRSQFFGMGLIMLIVGVITVVSSSVSSGAAVMDLCE